MILKYLDSIIRIGGALIEQLLIKLAWRNFLAALDNLQGVDLAAAAKVKVSGSHAQRLALLVELQ